MFGISGGELLIILVVVALVLGPKSVAQALNALKSGMKKFRDWSGRLREQSTLDVSSFGITQEDLDAIRNFSASDFDPRLIIQEAAQEEMRAWLTAASSGEIASMDPASTLRPSPTAQSEPNPKGDTDGPTGQVEAMDDSKPLGTGHSEELNFTPHSYLSQLNQGDPS